MALASGGCPHHGLPTHFPQGPALVAIKVALILSSGSRFYLRRASLLHSLAPTPPMSSFYRILTCKTADITPWTPVPLCQASLLFCRGVPGMLSPHARSPSISPGHSHMPQKQLQGVPPCLLDTMLACGPLTLPPSSGPPVRKRHLQSIANWTLP